MPTVTVSDEYTAIFAPLGDVQQAVDEALKRYAVEKISEQIADLRRRIRAEKKNTDAAMRHSTLASLLMRTM